MVLLTTRVRVTGDHGAKLERAVRPFAEAPPERPRPRPEPDQDAHEAELEWTATMRVETTSINGLGLRIQWSDELEDEEDEVTRQTRTERVENPEDPEQYVDVEVIEEIVFRTPNGRRIRRRLNN